MRLFLLLHDANGNMVAREKIVLDRLPEVGTALRPPISATACLVTGAVPASLEDISDIRFWWNRLRRRTNSQRVGAACGAQALRGGAYCNIAADYDAPRASSEDFRDLHDRAFPDVPSEPSCVCRQQDAGEEA